MKILYLTPGCFDKGGISRYNRYQISAFREIGGNDNIRVISLLGPEKDGFESQFKVHWYGGKVNLINKIKFIFLSILNALFWRPDIIITAHINFSGLALLLSWCSGAKRVLNVYGLEVWSGLSKDASLGLEKSEFIISDCHFTANYLKRHSNHSDKNINVIWDCVDLDQFKPDLGSSARMMSTYNLPDRNKHFIIATLGRIAFEAAHKGYDRLIQVFHSLSIDYPNARLVFAGKGNMVAKLKEDVIKLNLKDKVCFTGMIHDSDMAALYSYAHVFSLVSDRGKDRGEGIPLTPLEAMACGTPIIVGNHDGSQEAIFEGESNGFVIDPFNLELHKDRIIELMNDKELLEKKSAASIQTVKTHFSYTGFVEKHRNFINHLVLITEK